MRDGGLIYHDELAGAFVRGRLGDPRATLEDGARAGLRLHKFKKESTLPRVDRVLGLLRGLAPANLLDVGSGRGTFLWPLLASFPDLRVAAVDQAAQRASDLGAVRRGGVERLHAARMDVHHLGFANGSFDVVTLLEVLEHLAHPAQALGEAVRVARRFVIVSVPSVPDDNPEHLHLFTSAQLQEMALAAGAARVTVEHVLNHRIALIRVNT